jgi:hypothetical protein
MVTKENINIIQPSIPKLPTVRMSGTTQNEKGNKVGTYIAENSKYYGAPVFEGPKGGIFYYRENGIDKAFVKKDELYKVKFF